MKKYFLTAAVLLSITMAIHAQAATKQPVPSNSYKQTGTMHQAGVEKNNTAMEKKVTPAKTSTDAKHEGIKRKHHKKTGSPKKTVTK